MLHVSFANETCDSGPAIKQLQINRELSKIETLVSNLDGPGFYSPAGQASPSGFLVPKMHNHQKTNIDKHFNYINGSHGEALIFKLVNTRKIRSEDE